MRRTVGISPRTSAYLTAYTDFYVVGSMGLRVLEIQTSEAFYNMLLGGVNLLAISSILFPYIYFAKKLLATLGVTTGETGKVTVAGDVGSQHRSAELVTDGVSTYIGEVCFE